MTSATLERAAWIGTALFVAVSAVAVAVDGARPVAAAVSLVLFAAGCAAFLAAYARAVARSRSDEIGVASLFFLSGHVAPVRIRRTFMTALLVQVVAALAAAGARPFTPLAFGVLAPVYGLGLAGLWGARHATFAPRADVPGRGTRRDR